MAGYDYATISGNIKSVLTGEIWKIGSIGDLAINKAIKSVDGLPKVEMQTHEVSYRNKILKFPKYGNTFGEITIVIIENMDSEMRKSIWNNVELKTKDGVKKDYKPAGTVVLESMKNADGDVSRTYTLKGCIVSAIDDSLTFPEADGMPSEITLTISFSDFDIK